MITQLSRILSPNRCFAGITVDSRKRVLETISRACAADLDDVGPMDIFDCFIARERLGSTAMGKGVAIPHVRCCGIEQPMAVLLHLTDPVDYNAPDNEPVDLFFALLVPNEAEDEHVKILSKTAGMLNNTAFREKLRQAHSQQALYQQVLDYEHQTIQP